MWDMQPLTLNVSRSWLESHCALPLRPSSNMVRGKLHSVPQRDLYAQNWIVAASGTPKAAAKRFEEVEALAAKTTRGLQSVSHRKQMSLVLHWHTSVSYAAVYSCLLRSVSEAHWTVTPVKIRPRPHATPTPASASSGASGSLAKRERGHESFAQGTSGAAARRLTRLQRPKRLQRPQRERLQRSQPQRLQRSQQTQACLPPREEQGEHTRQQSQDWDRK